MSYSSDQSLLSNQLSTTVEFDKDKKEFNDVLNLQYRRVVDSVNSKEGAFYLPKELANFKQIYGLIPDPADPTNPAARLLDPQKNRNSYRTTLEFINGPGGWGEILPTVTANVPHNISSLTDSVLIYCSCRDSDGKLFTLVYPDAYIDSTNAYVVNTSATATIVQAMFVAEYTKN